MMIKRIFTLFLLFTTLVSYCFGQKKFSPDYDFTLLEHRIKTWVDSSYYTGASVIIGDEHKVLYKKYFGNYNSASTAYVASAGKWVAVATIASLVDEGKLSWDDKVRKWLPEFRDFKGDATLRQLLSHTAGFIPYQPQGHHPDNYQTLKQAVDSIIPLPADTLPGTKFLYGGLAMQVAGRMAEVATGKDWETLFQEKIGIPLHMQLTHFTPVDQTPGHNPMLGGGMKAGLEDYGNFLTMILNNGMFEGKRILSKQSIKEMQADQIHNAYVKMPEFPQLVRAATHHGIYGLGEMREEVDESGNATLLSSPGWAGAYPWIDKKYHIYGFFLTRINIAKDGFNSFLESPVLPYLVRRAIDRANVTDVK